MVISLEVDACVQTSCWVRGLICGGLAKQTAERSYRPERAGLLSLSARRHSHWSWPPDLFS